MHPYLLHSYAKARSAELQRQARPAHAPTAPTGDAPRDPRPRRRRTSLRWSLPGRLRTSEQTDAP